MAASRFNAFNTPGANPNLKDLLDAHKRNVMNSINCHAIGRVESFNASQQTAQVSIVYKRVVYEPDAKDGFKETAVNYPVLLDCPVVVMNGGGGRLTFPIARGDECLVLFNDRDIDVWWSGSYNNPVNSNRVHSLADALIIVGVKSKATFLENYDTQRVELSHDDGAKVALDDKVDIANSSTDLRETLEGLVNTLSTFMSATAAASTAAQIAAAAAAAQPGISTALTRIGNLLK